MKCTNIKCMALNLYICIHLCNLHATQDTERKVRNITEKKKLIKDHVSENTEGISIVTAMGNHSSCTL